MPCQPCGLVNLGSTCYINTALQCLARCDAFSSWALDERSGCRSMGCLMDALRGLLRMMQATGSGDEAVLPRAFLQALHRHIGHRMDLRCQNDLHEFLSIFIDRLNACSAPADDAPQNPSARRCTRLDAFHLRAQESWMRDHSERHTPAADILYGQMVNRIVCSACGGHGDVFGAFGALMVGLGDGDKHSDNLGELIAASISREKVSQRQCDVCKLRADGESCQMFYRLPHVLLVNIKRFDATGTRPVRSRLDVPLALDMSHVCLDASRPYVYDIVAVACHTGCLEGGHYYALIRESDDKWFIADDDVVRPLDPMGLGAADSSHFYVIFYQRRRGLRPPGDA